MNIASAILSFYLLLPVIYPRQQKLLNLVKPNPNEKENFLLRQELVEFLQNNINSQDALLNQQNALNLENFGEDADDFVNPKLAENQNQENQESVSQNVLVNSLNKIRLFEFGEEKLEVNSKNSKKSLVSVNSQTFTLSSYDENARLSEIVEWKNAQNSEDSVMLKKTSFSYEDGFDLDGKSIIKSSRKTVQDFQEKTLTVTLYNEDFLPIRSQKFSLDENQNRTSLQSSAFDYDEEKRVVQYREINYYKADNFIDAISRLSKKYVYKYSMENSNPDLEYYENNVLRLKIQYLTEQDYIETAFFDNDIKVESRYENNVKISTKIINLENNSRHEK